MYVQQVLPQSNEVHGTEEGELNYSRLVTTARVRLGQQLTLGRVCPVLRRVIVRHDYSSKREDSGGGKGGE